MEGICRVGYALSAKKLRKGEIKDSIWRGGGLADILLAPENTVEGVHFQSISSYNKNALLSKESRLPFHVVIYKLSDADKDDSHGQYLEMQEYIEQHPETVVIDPISAVHTVTSRLRTCDFLDNLVLSLRNKAYQLNNVDKEGAYGCDGPHKFTSPFRQPEYAKVDDIHQLRKCIASGKLTFPIICKPIHACGIPSSHLMVVLVSEESAEELVSFPCMLQQYYNHNREFVKVYVMDDEVMIHKRRSLPNLLPIACGRSTPNHKNTPCSCNTPCCCAHKEVSNGVGNGANNNKIKSNNKCMDAGFQCYRSLAFDSRKAYPCLHDFLPCANDAVSSPPGVCEDSVNDVISQELKDKLTVAATAIRNEIGLTLFGFDVIFPVTDDETAELIVIDVNFFPSYKEVSDFPSRLRALLRKKGGLGPFVPRCPSSAPSNQPDPTPISIVPSTENISISILPPMPMTELADGGEVLSLAPPAADYSSVVVK